MFYSSIVRNYPAGIVDFEFISEKKLITAQNQTNIEEYNDRNNIVGLE